MTRLNTEELFSTTHRSSDKLALSDISKELEIIKKKLSEQENGEELCNILDQLSEFELGRFLIKNNGGLSGYWTYYIILGHKTLPPANPLESFLLNKAPVILATQQRFAIFQNLLKKHIQSNSTVCSIPCGMMAELLTLDLPAKITELRFVGIDLDSTVFNLAKELAKIFNVKHQCTFFQQDAWQLNETNTFDIITTNGLNIYEKDNERVERLYEILFKALKPGGKLIGSALSCPPTYGAESEWLMEKINPDDLALQKLLFATILKATWSHFRTSKQTTQQLQSVGFDDVEIYWDAAKIFLYFYGLQKVRLTYQSLYKGQKEVLVSCQVNLP